MKILSGKRKRAGRRVRAVKMKQPWTGIHSMQRAPQDGTKAVFSWHYFFYICMCQTSLLPAESNPEASVKLLLHLQYLFINGKLWLGKTCCCWRSSWMFRFSDVQQWCRVVQCDGPCCGQARASAWKPIVTDRLTSLQKQVLIMGFLWMVPGAQGWAASEGPSSS